MWEIWILANPRLFTTFITKNQTVFPSTVAFSTNLGYKNIPARVGKVRRIPKTYQGFLFPHLVLNLSLRSPTVGVANPSNIYPQRRALEAIDLGRFNSELRYQVK
jgi:hypothetical protein